MERMQDLDPVETGEWVDSLRAVLHHQGAARATYLLERLAEEAGRAGIAQPSTLNTPYVNTIPPEREERADWDRDIEHRIRSIIRWNAVAIILRANKESSELGGHIASFQSAATLYDIGFGHFWHAPSATHGGDLIYMQGHSAPGIYARAFVEGRLSEQALLAFRQETGGQGLSSSYPHPWLMPDFWQFPTVSMGLGPLMAIYQARFLKYLHGRGIADTAARKVWAFMGDGEMDEPESLGAISLGGREQLDNLIFVINCNLQRLDGPVRGNGKIVQELEGVFRGAGWNVIKVLWGSGWDPLLAKDASGMLRKRMRNASTANTRTSSRRTAPMCASSSSASIRNRGAGEGHERRRHLGAAPWRQRPGEGLCRLCGGREATGQPTVILAKTVKGYGMGEAGEGQMITHQQKKMGTTHCASSATASRSPVTDAKLEEIPFLKLAEGGPE